MNAWPARLRTRAPTNPYCHQSADQIRARRALRPDGLFLASMFGGDTLHELKHAFILADMERHGGVHAHVSPFAGFCIMCTH